MNEEKSKSSILAQQLGLEEKYVQATIELLEDGATVPFISRYRKEATGGMNEVQVAAVMDGLDALNELERRREFVLSTIEAQGKLTDELRLRIAQCWDAATLEDLYLPYKQKRRTRAQIAREAGLEPMANIIQAQRGATPLTQIARRYLNPEKGIETPEQVIACAQDIIAERVSENERARQSLRYTFAHHAVIESHLVKGKDAEGQNFRSYFDWHEPLARCSSHRLLAMRRGQQEGILRLDIHVDDEAAIERIARMFVKADGEASRLVRESVEDGYRRLLEPSISAEAASEAKRRADEEAIHIFARNLEQLLMAPPLGQKRVLAIDPGFRTGCKVVCLDPQGELLHHEVIFPHPPRGERVQAMMTLQRLVERYHIEAISIGNGTAGRETEDFVRHLDLPGHVEVYSVSEDGASIYSASEIARQEFPDEDVTVRGAVSIGRRLMDPLSELVKIDPSSIGVGQYQKDVNQPALKRSLDQTVVSCVSRVGVNVNTASPWLLTYVSGLGPALAQRIVAHRAEHGPFATRESLKQVPRMGAKVFEQCAGFLRIPGSINPLDDSAVHPERYAIVEQMARDCGCSVDDLIHSSEMRAKIDLKRYMTDEVGLPTLHDILSELEKPSRDPREPLEEFSFAPDVHTLEDLHSGMILPGIVTNITRFGAFVDIGIHTQGLIHVSQMAERYVQDPTTVLSLGQHLRVRVVEVDMPRQRLSLSLRDVPAK